MFKSVNGWRLLMAHRAPEQLEEILNGFAEVISKIVLDLHQQHLAELDLTLSQAQALRVLRRDGTLPTGRLALELRISAPAVTQLTDRLIRKGLIARQAAAADRRTVLVALSGKGRRLIDQFRKRRCEIFSGALAQLREVERAEVIASLEKMVAALEQYESGLAIQGRPDASNVLKK
jgi:DNA-binding MarR family transcriptional regulator